MTTMLSRRFRALLLLLTPALLGVACTAAGVGPPAERQAAVERIVEEALLRGRTWPMLRELCTAAPHRLSGSEGAEVAVRWAHEAMNAAGLENVRLEPCTVPHWERGPVEELVFAEPSERAGEELPILALGGSIATPPEGIEAEVVAVRGFDELAELGDRVAGRIVLFAGPMDGALSDPFRAYGGAVGQRVNGAIEAARLGARAALVRSMSTSLDDTPHTGAMRYRDDVPRIPSAAVSTRGAERIEALLEQGERVVLRLRLDCRWNEPATSFNVVGELVGTELPEEVVVVGGHLDAWDVGQGAHDDGSGCCQSIEALRLLKDLGLRPRRTLRAVLFMNEENGRAGARAYHERHRAERHVLALESDRGAFTPRGFTTDARGPNLPWLRKAATLLEGIGADRVVVGGGGADIEFLREEGTVLVGYLPDPQRYFHLHHSAHDVLEAVDRRELELGTAAIASLAYLAADRADEWPVNPPQP